MPRGKSKKTYKKKQTTKRTYKKKPVYRKKRIGGPMRMTNSHDPFGPVKFCKMHYTETFGLTAGTFGAIGTEVIYGLNNLYDPNYSGTGHQPYGRDQVAALYQKYIVNAVKIDITFTNPSEDGLVAAAMIQPSGASYAMTGKYQDAVREAPGSCLRPINNTGKQVSKVVQYVSLQKLNGLSKVQWNTQLDTFGAAAGSSPTSLSYLRVAVGSDSGNTGGTLIGRVTLTFYCKWYERIVLGQS